MNALDYREKQRVLYCKTNKGKELYLVGKAEVVAVHKMKCFSEIAL